MSFKKENNNTNIKNTIPNTQKQRKSRERMDIKGCEENNRHIHTHEHTIVQSRNTQRRRKRWKMLNNNNDDGDDKSKCNERK